MNCENLRKLLDKSNYMVANNIWGVKAYGVNMKIWAADNNNFTACIRLAQYYKRIDNMPDAKRMYLKAIEIYPNNPVVKNNLNEIDKHYEDIKFIDDLTTSRECYNKGQKLTKNGLHGLASACYYKAYSIEPLLLYGVSLAKGYRYLGEHDKIKRIYQELMNNNTSIDAREDIQVEFEELLKYKKFVHKNDNSA